MIGIYKITNPIGEIYIGQSLDIEMRWLGYRRSKANKQPKLNNSFLLYGVMSHVFEVVCVCDSCELNAIEIYYIYNYDSFKNGLNSKDEINALPTRVKSKDEKDALWKIHLSKQLDKFNKRDLAKEKRAKQLKYRRSLRF